MLEPSLANERIEKPEPRVTQSSELNVEPNRIVPYVLHALPIRKKERMLIALPS